MIEQYLYDAVVKENEALKAEIKALRKLMIDEGYISQSPILPSFDLVKSDGD